MRHLSRNVRITKSAPYWLAVVIILCLSSSAFSQSAVVSSYYNATDPRDEWTELVVIQDNLDMRNWSLRDNNSNQAGGPDGWQTPITFNNISFWNHMRAGTIILVWHRAVSSAGTPNPPVPDIDPSDGYVEVAANDPAYFTGGAFGTAPLYAGQTLNISSSGDIVQLRSSGPPATSHIHALGHKLSPGADFVALSQPKLNHAQSLVDGEAVFVSPGTDLTYYGTLLPLSGTTYTAKATAPNLTRGLPNFSAGNTNSNFWRSLRQPLWPTPSLTAVSQAGNTQVLLTWNAATDPNPSDGTIGYLILRSNTNSFTDPVDGHTYSDGDILGGATVIQMPVQTSQTISWTDNYSVPCGTSAYYRVYAYRYATDNLNGNDFNVARGRSYNETNFAAASLSVLPGPSAQTMTAGSTSYCSGTAGVPIGLANSETGVSYQLYSDCPVPNTPVGLQVSGNTGSPVLFGNQTILPPGPCTFSVIGLFTAFPTCTVNMANTITVNLIPTPIFTLAFTNPTTCISTDGTITLNGLTANTPYVVNYSYNGTPVAPLNLTSTSTGSITINTLTGGNYTGITVTLSGCPSVQASQILTAPPTVTPSVVITADNTTICSGTLVTFTATPTNGGSTPSYQWKKNSTGVGINSPTYSDNTLISSDVINCQLSSSDICANPANAQSNNISVTVTSSVVPSVAVSPDNDTICPGTTVIFTAVPANGGTSPAYQWKKNGSAVGNNSPTYSDNTLVSSDLIVCELTSSNSCASPATVQSSPVSVFVTSMLVPLLVIAPDKDTICTGSLVTFTATPVNGGNNPTYQWMKNGANVGNNQPAYSDNTLTGSDVITCQLTSSEACANPATAVSNPVSVVVTTSLTPGISITADNASICSGMSVTFTAVPVNGGTTPFFQWKKNGLSVGSNNAVYTDFALLNGDVVQCELISADPCAIPNNAISNTVTITVTGSLVPSITIVPDHNPVCAGSSISFTASTANQGNTPTYQWKKNGVVVGANNSTYTDSSPATSDQITCTLVSSSACANPTTVTSNIISITVNPLPVIPPPLTTDATNGQANGSVTAATSATAPEYSIDGGTTWQADSTFSGLLPGNYTMTVRDISGCMSSVPFTIGNISLSTITFQADSGKACPGSSVFISIKAVGMANFMRFSICLTYNAAIAAFSGINNVNSIFSNVITDSSIPGQLMIMWTDTVLTTVPDNDLLFRLKFTGINSGKSILDWDDFSPGVCGVFNDTGLELTTIFNKGSATYYVAPVATILGNPDVCEGAPVVLDAAGDTLTYRWTIPGGFTYTGQHLITPQATSADSGPYVLLTTNSIGCTGTDTLEVMVHPNPTVNISPQDTLCAGYSELLDAGFGFATYTWMNGTTSQKITANATGTYSVTVTDQYGCSGSDSVYMKPCPAEFMVPTAFTPNHDGLNDIFRIVWNADEMPVSFQMQIYNRWGSLIFDTNNIANGWDGNFNNEPCLSGVYMYVISFRKPSGNTPKLDKTLRGIVTLVR